MSKRTNLNAALHEAGARPVDQGLPIAPETRHAPAVIPVPVQGIAGNRRPPSREGQRAVTLYIKPEAHKQLRLLSVEQGVSIQDLMTEALKGLFQRHGKSRIA